MFARIAIVALAGIASACSTTGAVRGPVDVIRYNLGTPIRPGTFSVDPLRSTESVSDEYAAYVNAVAQGLGGIGFSRVPDGSPSEYVLEVSFMRAAAGTMQTRSPVSIGLGGVSGGMGGGVGGGISTALGGQTRQVVTSELTAKIRRRIDNTVTWEGAARTQGTLPGSPEASADQARRMANALFQDFPGQSGITTTVQ